MNNTGIIIGAYPCAPSFHQKGEQEEIDFWRKLSDTQYIRGIEQPCLENLHPYGDEWLFRHTPNDWKIVVTAVMETMRQRNSNGDFGLASADNEQRKASVDFYRKLNKKINAINSKFPDKVLSLEMQAAPQAHNTSVIQATEAFARSIHEISKWDWSCDLVVEHCDAMTGCAPCKGFLPLEQVLEVVHGTDIGICINWARSAIEGRNTSLPLAHVQAALRAGKLEALMFSGTTISGEYGAWQDTHAPFNSFQSDSVMTLEHAKELLHAASDTKLSFYGIKMLEVNSSAGVEHRISILQDGISNIISATKR